MKIKIIILAIFFLILLSISFYQFNKKQLNYTIIGDKKYFKKNIISKNYADLVSDYLKSKNILNKTSKDFLYDDLRVTDLLNKINNNEIISKKTIQNTIYESDILLLNVGNNEINYKINNLNSEELNDLQVYNYLDEIINDLNKLINKISKISKTDIIFLGFFNETNNTYNDRYYKYINDKLKNNKNIIFIDLFTILNKNNNNLYKT